MNCFHSGAFFLGAFGKSYCRILEILHTKSNFDQLCRIVIFALSRMEYGLGLFCF